MENEVLYFLFYVIKKTIWLSAKKRDTLLLTISKQIRVANRRQQQDVIGAINFKEFQSVTSKLFHAYICILQANVLFSLVNQILALDPELVFLHQNPKLLIAIKDMKTQLRKFILSPNKCKELISGWTYYIVVKDVSGHGVGVVVSGENFPCTPTVFRMQWPEWVKIEITSSSNRMGMLTISDLEMAVLLLLWLVM